MFHAVNFMGIIERNPANRGRVALKILLVQVQVTQNRKVIVLTATQNSIIFH